MMPLVLLDAGLVGLAVSDPRGRNPQRDREGRAFRDWLAATSNIVHQFAVADITRFEIRRELLRIKATRKLRLLAELTAATIFVDITPEIWERAAELWAASRQQGWPTASPDALDGDAILAAAAQILTESGDPAIVATTNVKHLRWFGIDAREWRDIPSSG